MKKLLSTFCLVSLCLAALRPCFAAGRDDAVAIRTQTADSGRSAAIQKTSPNKATVSRSGAVTTPGRGTTARDVSNRDTNATVASRSARSVTTTTSRSATISAATRNAATISRSAARTPATTSARAAIKPVTQTFGAGYNTCRDAYFTCMDQFCAKADETYRRCVCSSRLDEIKGKERAISQTVQQLQDFKDLNIIAISKTGAEVKAMVNATPGEMAKKNARDTSAATSNLAGISAVLNKTKSDSLSTAGKLDIAGDVNAIWATSDLAGGADIMNLVGEKLYNAVNAQCSEFAMENCDTKNTLSMVVSAYGMYIENDCTNLSNALSKKTTEASGAIRQTEREMNLARLDNYDAHNATSINDCIAQVRRDVTSETACGPDYVHCLDITGQYLNRDTGAPIYTPNFYQLEVQTSLTGDVLTNQTNRVLVGELNRKKEFAKRGLDTCRDLEKDVWDEFMRQAVAEIYQGQQSRIRQVKNECIDVVNNCYDAQSKSLKDFSNIKEQLLLGARLELSEQMCRDKLQACSNLYGGGTSGLAELVATMTNITDQKIAKNCKVALEEYATEICAVPSSDIVHKYPYSCRTYAPGEQRFATVPGCNTLFINNQESSGDAFSDTSTDTDIAGIWGFDPPYKCTAFAKFTSCEPNYYMAFQGKHDADPKVGNRCLPCPSGYECAGGTTAPKIKSTDAIVGANCGDDYIGSLYQKMVRYAMQTCVRPTDANKPISTIVLGDINSVMDKIRVDMAKSLASECERLGGVWVDTPGDKIPAVGTFELFYKETSSNKKWGYCKPADVVTTP